jgi:hypothetical protein
MNKTNIKLNFIIILTALIFTSCRIPKETLEHIQSGKKEMIDFPVDYCNLFPTPTFEQWDKDYNLYNRFLTSPIMRTQLGLSWVNNGVQTWWCNPAVRTHVQLDTATMIKDKSAIIGEWRIVCNRKIAYTDSAVYANKKIYRNSKIIYDEKDADIFLVLTDNKLKLYGTEKGENTFKRVGVKHYSIENKRFLLLYGLFKAAAAVSFIGIDKDGHLIINSYWVEERKVKGIYITYVAVMTQMIFKRVDSL